MQCRNGCFCISGMKMNGREETQKMKLYQMVFSPTGGTKKTADLLTASWPEETVEIDLTDSRTEFGKIVLKEEDLAVLAVPSYAGRVPSPAVERIAAVRGNGAKAVLICVYGNRAYEDTLLELQDAAVKAGFHVEAAVTAVAEHSIVRRVAAGRPDVKDEKILSEFAEKIRKKLSDGNGQMPDVPGNRPYRKAGGVQIVPKAGRRCTKCGVCAKKCPVRAIDPEHPDKTDGSVCISCMRCVSVCPHSARRVNPVLLKAAGLVLKKACADRKECELFL